MFAHEHRSSKQAVSPVRLRQADRVSPAPWLPVVLRKVCACGGGCPRCSAQKAVSQDHDYGNDQHDAQGLRRTSGNRLLPRPLSHPVALQPKLTINQPGDQYEQEADRVAEQVMRMPNPSAPVVQRKCASCQEEENPKNQLQRQESGSGPELAPPIVHEVLSSPGSPLDPGTRQFMEPRFGHDFSDVRVHSSAKAAESARSVGSLAYTSGSDIVFGAGQYAPQSAAGRRLLAHELTHVMQQGQAPVQSRSVIRRAGTPVGQPPRQAPARGSKIDPSCAAHEDEINAAWDRAVIIVHNTISDLETIEMAMTIQGGPRKLMARRTQCILISFGDVGGLEGSESGGSVFTLLKPVIDNFGKIQSGFTGGRNLRCDPDKVAKDECDWRDAFVIEGNSSDIFLCPHFFDPGNDVVVRAVTLIHEMAHSVLHVRHQGIPEKTFPATFFDYSIPLGLDFDDARRNAFAYEILANCLEGNPPSSVIIAPQPKGAAVTPSGSEPRGSISVAGGVAVAPGTATPAVQGLAGIAGRLSLRPGSMVIFNPYLGLNVLYSPTADIQPSGFLTGMAEAGLRIQQPTRGAYLDLFGGGFVGFEAPLRDPLRATAGLEAGVGAGWRWDRIELGAEARALIPLSQGDPNNVVVLGRVAFRFGSTK